MDEPIISPDGKFMWTGKEWIPAPPKEEEEEKISEMSQEDMMKLELIKPLLIGMQTCVSMTFQGTLGNLLRRVPILNKKVYCFMLDPVSVLEGTIEELPHKLPEEYGDVVIVKLEDGTLQTVTQDFAIWDKPADDWAYKLPSKTTGLLVTTLDFEEAFSFNQTWETNLQDTIQFCVEMEEEKWRKEIDLATQMYKFFIDIYDNQN